MKYNKIDGLLRIKGMNLTDFADHLGVKKQQISNKKESDSFRADELIKLADLTGTTLAFLDDKGKPVITFDIDDIPKKTR